MLVASAALAGAASWGSGCSVLYDLSTQQCSVDADCSAWAGLICTGGICQEPDFECRTNEECINSQEFFGSAAACIQNECQALQTAECPTILPQTNDAYLDNLIDEDPLILGAFGETGTGTLSNLVKNYDLAITDFERAGVGRPLVMVVCNDQPADDAELDAAMTHLAETLQVPGVVASLESSNLQRAVEGKGLENNMFFISAYDSDSTLIRLDDGGLLWHMLSGGEALAQSYAPIVTRAIEYIQPTEPVRVAQVIAPDIRLLQDISEVVLDTVTFNDKTALDNLAEDNYLPVNVTSYFVNQTAVYTEQIQRLRDFKPHIIIATATREFVRTIAPQIEQNWDTDAPGQPRPFYIMSPILYGDPETLTFASTPALRSRIVGLNAPAAPDATVYQKYIANWEGTFNEDAPEGIENFYDAAHYLLYSAVAAGERLQTGEDLLRGMGRLISTTGLEFEVGFDDLADAAFALNTSNAAISLIGTMGPPNFDNNGGRADAGSVWCFNALGARQSDVMTYNKDSGQMDGSLDSCFTGF